MKASMDPIEACIRGGGSLYSRDEVILGIGILARRDSRPQRMSIVIVLNMYPVSKQVLTKLLGAKKKVLIMMYGLSRGSSGSSPRKVHSCGLAFEPQIHYEFLD